MPSSFAALADPSSQFSWRTLTPHRAKNLGCGQQTVRNAIHAFNERGLGALQAGSSRPKEVHAAFDAGEAESLRQMLHHHPSNCGKERAPSGRLRWLPK
jgi:hypothetical protein